MAFTIPENEKTITIRLKKRELIDVMKACTLIQFDEIFLEETRNKYRDIHDKLMGQITKWEEK